MPGPVLKNILNAEPFIRTSPSSRKTLLSVMPASSRYLHSIPMEKLTVILDTIDNAGHKAVHFVSPYTKEGNDIIAFETAYLAAAHTNRRVLFIDAGDNARGLIQRFKARVQVPLNHAWQPKASNDTASPFVRLKGTSLSFAALSLQNQNAVPPLNRDYLTGLFTGLRKKYDLIILHSDSSIANNAASIFAPVTDGAIIVIEAERIRIPVIDKIKKDIESHGGRITGTVLNRRRYYIPHIIYKSFF